MEGEAGKGYLQARVNCADDSRFGLSDRSALSSHRHRQLVPKWIQKNISQ